MKSILYLSLFILNLVVSCKPVSEKKSPDTKEKDTAIISGKPTSAELTALNQEVKAHPGNPSSYNERAKYYVKKNNPDAAYLDLLNGFRIDSMFMPLYNTLADYHIIKGEPAQAKAALEKGISVNKKSYMTYVKLGELFFLAKKYDLAFEKINEGLRINKYYSDGYFWKGMIYKERGERSNAISNFMTAVEQDPENYKAYIQMGMMTMETKDKKALDHFNAAIKIKPELTEGYYARAYYYQLNDELDKSIQDYTKVIQLDSSYTNAHYNLGVLHYELRVLETALSNFNSAIKYNPKYAEAYYMRGLCNEALSKDSEAISDYEFALGLKPNYELAKKGIERANYSINIKK